MDKTLKICAGVVLYHPDTDRLKLNIEAVLPQVDKLILVDNTPEEASSMRVGISNEAIHNNPKIAYVGNNENLGIAAALNQIMNFAAQNSYEWVLTLDQDSICSEGLVKKLSEAAYGSENAAMVSPKIIEHGEVWEDAHSKPMRHCERSEAIHNNTDRVAHCITSGTLTNVAAVEKAGGFDERLFIDEVDRDMSIRLRRLGYDLLRVIDAELDHEFGTKLVHRRIFFKTYTYRNYSPFRVYYHNRNIVYMVRKYGSDFKPYPAWQLIRPFFVFVVKFIFEPQRFARLKAFFKGYFTGLFMKI